MTKERLRVMALELRAMAARANTARGASWEHGATSATLLIDAADSLVTFERLAWGVVHNAGRGSLKQMPRWAHVRDAMGVGSTTARELCALGECDPDEMVPCDAYEARKRAPVQADPGPRPKHPAGTISWDEHVEAWNGYSAIHGTKQSAERIAERHGFSFGELVMFLGHEPKTWEPVR